jgi:hypothetical protein
MGSGTMRLSGFAIKNFRSVGDKFVTLKPLKRCNILVGQNNSGKSNVLRGFYQFLPKRAFLLEGLDRHKRQSGVHPEYRIWVHMEGHRAWDEFEGMDREVHFHYRVEKPEHSPLIGCSLWKLKNQHFGNAILKSVGARVPGLMDPASYERWMNDDATAQALQKLCVRPPVRFIPEFRRIQEGEAYSVDGSDLIAELASYQHPRIGEDEKRHRFDAIEKAVRRLLHLREASLEVDVDKKNILLRNGDLRLPLQSYGTGVHELVILLTHLRDIPKGSRAAPGSRLSLRPLRKSVLTAVLREQTEEGTFVCIEEPEIHLHPRLQREFIDFILRETTNSYLISTHSPTFINCFADNPGGCPSCRGKVAVVQAR